MSKLSQFSNLPQNEKEAKEELNEKFNLYKDMNKQQLNEQLMQEVARQKQAGSFDFATLSNMVESLKSVLPETDYQNVKRILESLR